MTPSERETKALELFVEYRQQVHNGDAPTRAELLARHPDLATELEELLEGLDVADAAADRERNLRRNRALALRTTFDRLRDVDRYEVGDVVGQGGMGTVRRAFDRKLGRTVAMKWINLQLCANDPWQVPLQSLQRFLKEAETTSRLDHVAIAPVHDVGVDAEGRVFYTMKLVEGTELTRHFDAWTASRRQHGARTPGYRVHGERLWTLNDLMTILVRVGEAVAFAHERGVLHRDLKPGNVMLGSFGEVYVMDWGLARRGVDAPADTAADGSSDGRQTLPGSAIGTPYYMPPEQAVGDMERIGPWSDVYSLGAMIYELLTGAPPYARPGEQLTSTSFLARIRAGRPAEIPPSAGPAELVAICEKAMAYEPEQRFRTMTECLDQLRHFVEGRVVSVYATGPWQEIRKWVRRNRALATVMSSAALLLTVGLAVVVAQNRRLEDARQTIADANVDLKQKAAELADTVRKFEELSGVVQVKRAIAEEEALYPAWPDKVPAMDVWLDETSRLLGKEQQLRATIATLRRKALPMTSEEIDEAVRAHPRSADYVALERRIGAMRAAQDVRSGRVAWVEPELPAELRDKTPTELNEIAWHLVDWQNADRPWGQERLALACARLAVAGATTDSDRASFGDTLAWALFFCGRDAEAREQAQRNVELAGERREEFEAWVEELRQRVTAIEGDAGERAVALAERELRALQEELRPWRFGDSDDEAAADFLLGALTDLLGDFAVLEERKADVLQRRRWAQRIVDLTLRHPNRGADWGDVRRGIAASPKYAGFEIALGDEDVVTRWLGLVPIGENPVTGLWEFYHLRSAWDGESDPAGIPVPRHTAAGSIEMTGETGIVFVLLPGGAFTMGAQSTDPHALRAPGTSADETPLPVTLEPFLLARHELTQAQWMRLTCEANGNPSQYPAGTGPITWTNPVESIDCTSCDVVLGRHGLSLPTEAQWEYGCRSGTTGPWVCEYGELKRHANVADQAARRVAPTLKTESWDDGHAWHSPVGTFAANAFGLYDVHGNVWEWCLDETGRRDSPLREGDGLLMRPDSRDRQCRGGSFSTTAEFARSSRRRSVPPAFMNGQLGLRAARSFRPLR